MKVTTTLGPVSVLSVSGYIDAATFPQLVKEADEVLNSGHVNLVLDLGGVDYVSSAGLRVLLMAAKAIKQKNGKLALYGLTETVQEIFEISGFDKILTISAEEADALNHVR